MEEIKVGLHNEWKIVVRDAKTGEVKREAKGHNILLNQWWTNYLSGNTALCLRYIHFGSGTATPVATNTKLTSPIGGKDAGSYAFYQINRSRWQTEGVLSVEQSVRLEANEYIGQTISEVGFAISTNTSANLVTHSLITDMNGNAISIPKQEDEVIDIFGTVFFHLGWELSGGRAQWTDFPLNESTDTRYLLLLASALCCSNSESIGNSLLSSGVSWPKSGFGMLTGKQKELGQQALESSYRQDHLIFPIPVSPTVTYNVGARKLMISIADFSISQGNDSHGIGCLLLGGLFIRLPIEGFSQPIIEKEVVGIGDGSTKDFITDFGFVKNNGVSKIYVNDLEVSGGVDFNTPVPVQTNFYISPYVNMIEGQHPRSFTRGIANKDNIFENPYYNVFGITSVSIVRSKLYVSDDLENWELLINQTSYGTYTIPETKRNKRYWKWVCNEDNAGLAEIYSADFQAYKNVHLASAPASGDTVAVTYQPDCIAKDSQHILKNISVTLSFNEYTP